MEGRNIFKDRLNQINPEIKKTIDLSVAIANRIYDILDAQNLSQKDFAKKIGKSEAEVSRWMQGTHNFTLKTLSKIEVALHEPVIDVCKKREQQIFRGITINHNDFNNFSTRTIENSDMRSFTKGSKQFSCGGLNNKHQHNYGDC